MLRIFNQTKRGHFAAQGASEGGLDIIVHIESAGRRTNSDQTQQVTKRSMLLLDLYLPYEEDLNKQLFQ